MSRRGRRSGAGRGHGRRPARGRSTDRGVNANRGYETLSTWRELEARVIDTLEGGDQRALRAADLSRELSIPIEEHAAFKGLLIDMQHRGLIDRVRGHRFAVSRRRELLTGPVAVTRDGHGFVRADDGGSDVYVSAHRLDSALDGDTVVVRVEGRPRGRNREGSVVRVLERARESVVGTFHSGRKSSFVRPLNARVHRDVVVSPVDTGGAKDGQVVVARIDSFGAGHSRLVGSVQEVLGYLWESGVDVLAVAHDHGVSVSFPPDLLTEARRIAEAGLRDPGPDRIDRTELLAFTIDPADAKDHDDALSIEILGEGRVEVGVHIADVSHFVRPDGPIDVEAAARGTSVYLVDRTVPMLPPVLSNDVCSLNPGIPRFALSVFLTLDGDGVVRNHRYEHTLIQCRAALSYEQAQEVLDGRGSIDSDIDEALRTLDDHARAFRAGRAERGALDLDLPESRVILDPEGVPVDIRQRERTAAHRLIEEYMILANEVVATDLEMKGLPALYRIHEPPAREKVELLRETLARYGVQVPRGEGLEPRHVQKILASVRGRDEEALVSALVLRSLRKARYDASNVGHFGLASEAYAHFTSPIRRYPDLVVHRVISACLVRGSRETPYSDEEDLARLAERCSSREQSAAEAERESVALKKAEFMERHLGDEFTGRVSGVASFGFFVTLEEFFVEGLVHVSAMRDDYYRLEERQLVLVGERGGKTFRLGDRVLIQVARVDKELRKIDFTLVRRMSRSRTPPRD